MVGCDGAIYIGFMQPALFDHTTSESIKMMNPETEGKLSVKQHGPLSNQTIGSTN